MPHTPGPWKFVEGDKTRSAMSDIMKADNEDFRIGYVLCDSRNEQARAEDIANGRLIAAAPELLACVEVWLEEMRQRYAPVTSAQFMMAQAAIAKATVKA